MSKEPGLQYPGWLDPKKQEHAALRNVFDNLFFLRGALTAAVSTNTLTRQELQQLVTQIVNNTVVNITGTSAILTGTHAIRLTTAVTAGAMFFETDRLSLYVGSDSTGVLAWTWCGGNFQSSIVNQPTDLGPADQGFLFTSNDTDTQTSYVWTGTAFLTVGGYLNEMTDAINNAVVAIINLRHLTSGVVAQGFGASILTQLQDSGGTTRNAAEDSVEWDTAATNNSLRRWKLRVAGVVTDLMQLASATLTIIGNYVWKSGTAFTGTLDHANTGNRTYTLPDADGNLTYETGALTNNNFVLGGGNALVKDAGFSRGTIISDTAYGSGWNGVTDVAPSQNAVYDEMETVIADVATKLTANGVNFGPGLPTSVTVVDGQITAIS